MPVIWNILCKEGLRVLNIEAVVGFSVKIRKVLEILKRSFIYGVFVNLTICPFALPKDVDQKKTDKHQEAIIVTRPKTENSNFLCGRVTGIIDAPVDLVWAVLSDYNHFSEFLPRMPVTFIVDAKVIHRIDKTSEWSREELETLLKDHRIDELKSDTVYFYNVLDMPSPVGDRWYLLKMIRNPKEHYVCWSLVVGNMILNEGSWKLSPCVHNPERTLATYTTCSDSGIRIPKFIMTIGLNTGLPDIIKGLRKQTDRMKKGWNDSLQMTKTSLSTGGN